MDETTTTPELGAAQDFRRADLGKRVTVQAEPSPQSPISAALDRLDGQIARTAAIVDSAGERLVNVLHPGANQDGELAKAELYGVPMIDAVDFLEARLRAANDELAWLLERLAL